jgi:hypothetical protein
MQKRVAPSALAACRLRAVGTILGTAAGLDRQQRRHLDGVRIVVVAMHTLGTRDQVVERRRKQGQYFGPRPVVARRGFDRSHG